MNSAKLAEMIANLHLDVGYIREWLVFLDALATEMEDADTPIAWAKDTPQGREYYVAQELIDAGVRVSPAANVSALAAGMGEGEPVAPMSEAEGLAILDRVSDFMAGRNVASPTPKPAGLSAEDAEALQTLQAWDGYCFSHPGKYPTGKEMQEREVLHSLLSIKAIDFLRRHFTGDTP